ncbi:adenylosuccinate lyase [Flavivirga aquimarina]|uniref:Adenylosuccinate lyase n=1 Tax=Flavivirga aquimarina TaxID=2027862 RepID=A0ABT8W9V3_9FLAO|nr:adenylosuccinate lyase [Flavivirga aquimarina]MDO5969834.1 adenylosuccinate lyase [Flavivirga aquimarina]
MTLEEFYKELSYINASRENRTKYANIVLNDMSLLPKLIDILFMVDDKVSCRAAWVLEFVCAKYIYAIVPYLDIFTKNIGKVHLDSSVRPVSKICEHISKAYYSKEPNTIKKTLNPEYRERIIEACFDWMISDQKVAPKAYAMDSLFLFGKDYDWIHPELVQILKQDFPKQSAGFKARARRILQKTKIA